jgi:hypothetical protein
MVALGVASAWYVIVIPIFIYLVAGILSGLAKFQLDPGPAFVLVYVMGFPTLLLVSALKVNRLLRPPKGEMRVFVVDLVVGFGCLIAFFAIMAFLHWG